MNILELRRLAGPRALLMPLLLLSVSAGAYEGSPSPTLSALSSMEAGGAGSLGASYDGSAGRTGQTTGRGFFHSASDRGGFSRFRNYSAPGRGGRVDAPSPNSSQPKSGMKPWVKKAFSLAAGALLGVILFGGIVGALAGITLFTGLRALAGKLLSRLMKS